jgi:hypothetical protein
VGHADEYQKQAEEYREVAARGIDEEDSLQISRYSDFFTTGRTLISQADFSFGSFATGSGRQQVQPCPLCNTSVPFGWQLSTCVASRRL